MSRYNTDMRILLTLTICCLAMPLQAQPDARLRIIRGGLVNRPGEQFSITELSPTVYVDEATSEVRSQIARANQFLVDEHWSEAIGMLMRVAESPSSRLTSSRRNPSKLTSKSKSGYKSYVSIPEFVTQSLSVVAKRSPKTFATYRERISPLASQWLAEATEQRDEEQLKRIVRDYFHSEAGDEALLLLGDWALEAGRTDAAREYWSRLHWQLQWQNWPQQTPFANRLRRGEVVSSLVRDLIAAVDFDKKIPSRVEKAASDLTCYVQSDVPMADVWARFTLASIIEGDLDRARSELDVMRKTWPNATGTVGGKSGKFVKLVSSLLNQSRQWAPPNAVLDWSTFAGNTDRNKVSASVIDIPLEPSWRTPLATLPAGRPGNQNRGFPTQKIGERTDAPSRHFPIVVGDLVFVHDASRIRCLRLRDGKPAWSSSGDGTFFSNTRNDETGIKFSAFGEPTVRIGEPRFMLSATGDTLVATLGSYQGGSGTGNPGVIGFDLKTEGGVQFGPVEIDDGTWTFQGVPVCEGTRCWIGLRQRNTPSQDFVACFDMTTGEELWRTKICSADSIGQNSALELSNHLLTKHEDRIYYSSHLGTVAAVDASDGSIQWVTAYARQGLKRTNLLEQPWQGLRDLTPCLYHDGLLIVAPADSTQIFAFHAMTGKPIWQTDFGRDANQLLGVGDNGHLIVSGRRLWWIDVATGVLSRKVKVNPFPSSNVADPRGAGRGVLSGGSVYWPTIDDDEINKIYVLSQANGESQRQPIDLEQGNTKAGNLIVTPSHLLIAAPDELVGYAIQQTEAEEP